MEAIAQRSHSAMVWLLGLGLIASWAAFDQPPPVIDAAYGIALRVLGHPESIGIKGDPLAGLPPGVRAPLAQVRHEYFRTGAGFYSQPYQECCAALGPLTVDAMLLLAREALKLGEQSESAASLYFLTFGALRRDLARLEAWHHKGGLSSSATLADLQSQLGSRIQVPGTEQSLDVPHCLVFVGLGIVALQLYLMSLLATMVQLPADASVTARDWVVLHRPPLGPVLATLWIWLPGIAWFLAAVIMPLGRMESHPTAIDWSIAAAVGATLVPMPRLLLLVRRRHLSATSGPSASLPLAVPRQAA